MSRALKSLSNYFRRSDKIFWLLSIAISSYALLPIASVSRLSFTDPSYTNYFKTQLVAVIIGYIGAILLTLIDYRAIAE